MRRSRKPVGADWHESRPSSQLLSADRNQTPSSENACRRHAARARIVRARARVYAWPHRKIETTTSESLVKIFNAIPETRFLLARVEIGCPRVWIRQEAERGRRSFLIDQLRFIYNFLLDLFLFQWSVRADSPRVSITFRLLRRILPLFPFHLCMFLLYDTR